MDSPEKNPTGFSDNNLMTKTKNYAIVRISNPVRKNYKQKKDYIQKIKTASKKRGSISFFGDQYLTLTYIPSLTQVLQKIIKIRNLIVSDFFLVVNKKKKLINTIS